MGYDWFLRLLIFGPLFLWFCIVQVLNETSLWWFDRTQHITSNAVVSVPDKNVTIAQKCSVFPVEFVGESLRNSQHPFHFD